MKSKNRFNIIDVTIIIAVLALASAFLFRFLDAKSDLGTESSIVKYDKPTEFVLHVKSLQKASGDLIKPGDIVYDTNSEMPLGEIVKVDITPAIIETSSSSGRIILSENPLRINLDLTLKTNAHISAQGSYYIGAYSLLAINKDFSCRTNNLLFESKVYSIKRIYQENITQEAVDETE